MTVVLVGIYKASTGYMAFAGLTYFTLVFGLVNKKNKYLHVRLMSTAMIVDVSLVLLLEIQRNAIETTLESNLNWMQQTHIYSSTLAVLFYIPAAILGYKLYNNLKSSRAWHLRLGGLAFLFRTIGFILMFSLIEHVKN